MQFPRISGKSLSGKSLSLPLPHVSLVLVSMRGLGMVSGFFVCSLNRHANINLVA